MSKASPSPWRCALLPPLLLTEVQRQQHELEELRQTLAEQRRKRETLTKQRRLR